jgi:hypothetical protein
VDVEFRTGSIPHRLSEETATLLAENLRAVPLEEGSRPAADKIERYLVGETTEPVEFADDERVAVREALDVLMTGPDALAVRQLWAHLGSENLYGS